MAIASAIAFLIGRSEGTIFCLVAILPLLAVGSRRLHDTGRSGWLQLFGLVLAVFLAQQGKAGR